MTARIWQRKAALGLADHRIGNQPSRDRLGREHATLPELAFRGHARCQFYLRVVQERQAHFQAAGPRPHPRPASDRVEAKHRRDACSVQYSGLMPKRSCAMIRPASLWSHVANANMPMKRCTQCVPQAGVGRGCDRLETDGCGTPSRSRGCCSWRWCCARSCCASAARAIAPVGLDSPTVSSFKLWPAAIPALIRAR